VFALLTRRSRLATVLILALGSGACFIVRSLGIESVPKPGPGTPITTESSPMKAHLDDGTIIVYPNGAAVSADTLRGTGSAYDLALKPMGVVTRVPMSRVLAMEVFRTGVNPVGTFLVSTFATAAVIGGSIAIYCATNPKCFGSCPTAYIDSAGVPVLEAEGFSYSIAPLFEMRDVDRLRVRAGPDGAVRLEIRNEALETHYINQLELLEVRHAPEEMVLPDPAHHPIAVRGLRPPLTATDRAGHDVLPALAAHDGVTFRTDSTTLARADAADPEDWIDLEVPVPPGADSVALVLRMRNSLLNTVLLYDLMLGDRGLYAVDYLGRDLQRSETATGLAAWYAAQMGMRVRVWDGSAWKAIGRIPDTGPIAWKDVAFMVPAAGPGALRVRLSFPADNWRIDYVAVASAARPAVARTIPLARVLDSDGHADSAALANLRAADGRYVQTSAGQRFEAVFETGPEPADSVRTFLLGWQGFYDEWIRRSWVQAGRDQTAFRPGPEALAQAIARWRTTQDSTELVFNRTRVPVR
jgi:hypothetical protein